MPLFPGTVPFGRGARRFSLPEAAWDCRHPATGTRFAIEPRPSEPAPRQGARRRSVPARGRQSRQRRRSVHRGRARCGAPLRAPAERPIAPRTCRPVGRAARTGCSQMADRVVLAQRAQGRLADVFDEPRLVDPRAERLPSTSNTDTAMRAPRQRAAAATRSTAVANPWESRIVAAPRFWLHSASVASAARVAAKCARAASSPSVFPAHGDTVLAAFDHGGCAQLAIDRRQHLVQDRVGCRGGGERLCGAAEHVSSCDSVTATRYRVAARAA